jgi:hypothetical protein
MELEKTDFNITMESTDTDTDMGMDMVMDTAMDRTKNNSHVKFFPIVIGYGHIVSQESIVEELNKWSSELIDF